MDDKASYEIDNTVVTVERHFSDKSIVEIIRQYICEIKNNTVDSEKGDCQLEV